MVLMAAVLLTGILETEARRSFTARLKAKRFGPDDFLERVEEACEGTYRNCRGRPDGASCCRNSHCYLGVCYINF
nr:TPA_inf: conotoxin precursor Cerm10 [Conus judaeus]